MQNLQNKKDILKEITEKCQVPVGFSTHEVASIFRVSFTTVITWIKRGKMKSYRTLGGHRRILPSEVEKMSKMLSDINKNPTPKPTPKPTSKSTKNPAPKPTPKPTNKPIAKAKVKIVSTKKPISTPNKKVIVNKKPINKI